MSPRRKVVGLVVALLASLAASSVGGAFTASSVDTWYQELSRPSWNPPNIAFPIVWTALFVAMAVAAWDVWRRQGDGHRRALAWYGAQLVLNVTWSALFFGLRRPDLALIEIAVLVVVLGRTTWLFFRQSRLAGGLMAPYLAWAGFATALNAAIVSLN